MEQITGTEKAKGAESYLGAHYAVEFMSHLRRYPKIDCWGNLAQIVERMTGQKFDLMQNVFFATLSEFIALGPIRTVWTNFDAVPTKDEPPE